jgi:nicotinamidase-related amidase
MTTRLGTRVMRLLLGLAIAAATTAGPAGAQTVPAMPAPVAVTLAPATTALLVMDVIAPICNAQQPNCLALVPRVANLIAAARKAGVWVLYSAAAPSGLVAPVAAPPFLAAIAPQSGDPIVLGAGQDRFYSTALDGLLRAHGITTVILAGWRENGSVLYTAVGANLHGYTAVVAEDSTSATTDSDIAIGRYQLLTQLSNNAKNEPLKKGAVTLSRGDLITFR